MWVTIQIWRIFLLEFLKDLGHFDWFYRRLERNQSAISCRSFPILRYLYHISQHKNPPDNSLLVPIRSDPDQQSSFCLKPFPWLSGTFWNLPPFQSHTLSTHGPQPGGRAVDSARLSYQLFHISSWLQSGPDCELSPDWTVRMSWPPRPDLTTETSFNWKSITR